MEPVLPDRQSTVNQLERRTKYNEVASKFADEKENCHFAQPRLNYDYVKVDLDDTDHPSVKGRKTLLESIALYTPREVLIAAEEFITASGRYHGVTVAHKYGCTMCFQYKREVGRGENLCSDCIAKAPDFTPGPGNFLGDRELQADTYRKDMGHEKKASQAAKKVEGIEMNKWTQSRAGSSPTTPELAKITKKELQSVGRQNITNKNLARTAHK